MAILVAPRPAAAHKISVRDTSTAESIRQDGGELLADYGSSRVYEVDHLRPEWLQSDTADVRDDWNQIRLNAASIDTSPAAVKAVRRPAATFRGNRMHLIQFVGPVQPVWHEALKKTGVRIVSYIPENAYLVYGDASSIARLQDLGGSQASVQWDGDYHDDYKIHPNARLRDKNGNLRQLGTDEFAIQLVVDPDANPATLALIDRLKRKPIHRRYNSLGYVNLFARLDPQDLGAIAAQPDVVSIQSYTEPRKQDERQDQIVAGNLSGNVPSGPGYLAWLTSKGFTQAQFTASGFVVDISDSGIDDGTPAPGHFALYALGDTNNVSRVIYNRLEGSPNPGSTVQGCDGHGTINAHIVGGYDDQPAGFPHTDSGGYYYGLGVCPFVNVGCSVIFDPVNFTNPTYEDLMSEAYHDGARISNNSWGGGSDSTYNSDSQRYDALVRDAQPAGSSFSVAGNQEMVIVFSDGDAGPATQSISAPGTAKNVITVGGSENVRSMTAANGGNTASSGDDGCDTFDIDADSANDVAGFSSLGPCSDGRNKPDLVAPCSHITGGAPQSFPPSDPTGTGSALSCFLNFAAEFGAGNLGVCALVGSSTNSADNFFPLGQQFFTESSGTSHSAPAVAGACALLRQYFINQALPPPSPAMTKAYLMNSARYLTGSGANDTLWSDSQGMGELNLGMTFDGTVRTLRDEIVVDEFTSSGQTRMFSGTVNDSSKPFRVTVAWTDAPGSTTGKALHNDLDLTVSIGGNIYKGNVFSGNQSVTNGSADHLNNVESVFLPAGVTGNFTITITAANINSDGVPGNGISLDQDFALVVYNGTAAPSGGTANFAVVAGVYQGLVQSNSPSQQTSGSITITSTASGSFSAKLTMGGVTYSFKSVFDNNGNGTSIIPRVSGNSLTVTLQIDLTNGTDQITGTVSDGTFTSALIANRSVFSSRNNPATQYAGYYTIVLPPNPGDTGPSFPQGDGFGTVKVDTSGRIKLSATLGDGAKISQSAVVSKDGAWPVFLPLYSKHGLLSGWVTFTNTVGVSDLGGTLSWSKPAGAPGKTYPNGFTTQVTLVGAQYVAPPAGTPALPVNNTACNLLITTGSGDLASFASNSVTLDVNNKVSLCDTNRFKLSIKAKTGLFSGSFIDPSTAKSTTFNGALLQKQNDGAGFFLSGGQTGFATAEPAP